MVTEDWNRFWINQSSPILRTLGFKYSRSTIFQFPRRTTIGERHDDCPLDFRFLKWIPDFPRRSWGWRIFDLLSGGAARSRGLVNGPREPNTWETISVMARDGPGAIQTFLGPPLQKRDKVLGIVSLAQQNRLSLPYMYGLYKFVVSSHPADTAVFCTLIRPIRSTTVVLWTVNYLAIVELY